MFNKEKLKNMFKGKRKTENIVVLIIILIITVVAINYIWNDDNSNNDEGTDDVGIKEEKAVQVSNNNEEDGLETKLEGILEKISGVGKVKVMLTYTETSELKLIYNEDSSTSNTNETDSSGGTRTVTENDSQKEVVFKENTDGSKEPITQSISSPKIEGAVVVAEGADNPTVKTNIIQAIEAATDLATHKIQVFKMEEDLG